MTKEILIASGAGRLLIGRSRNMAIVKEADKRIKKCIDCECVWHLDKYENGCGKYPDVQTCIERNGKMTREEAEKLGLV